MESNDRDEPHGRVAPKSYDTTQIKVVRSHSLGEFWKSALHKSMSAKAPGAGESLGKEWTTMEPNSEIKLVRVSEGTFRARF